jgi:hypothetical protein
VRVGVRLCVLGRAGRAHTRRWDRRSRPCHCAPLVSRPAGRVRYVGRPATPRVHARPVRVREQPYAQLGKLGGGVSAVSAASESETPVASLEKAPPGSPSRAPDRGRESRQNTDASPRLQTAREASLRPRHIAGDTGIPDQERSQSGPEYILFRITAALGRSFQNEGTID